MNTDLKNAPEPFPELECAKGAADERVVETEDVDAPERTTETREKLPLTPTVTDDPARERQELQSAMDDMLRIIDEKTQQSTAQYPGQADVFRQIEEYLKGVIRAAVQDVEKPADTPIHPQIQDDDSPKPNPSQS